MTDTGLWRPGRLRISLAAALALAALSPDRTTAQEALAEATGMLAVQGGGFIFNYRLGEAFYGIVLKPQRTLPEGTRVEVAFEDPAGGEPLVAAQTFGGSPKAMTFQTPPVSGVVAGHAYAVTVRLRDPATDAVFAQSTTSFRSNVDQSRLPKGPTTVGPGYQRPPSGPAQ